MGSAGRALNRHRATSPALGLASPSPSRLATPKGSPRLRVGQSDARLDAAADNETEGAETEADLVLTPFRGGARRQGPGPGTAGSRSSARSRRGVEEGSVAGGGSGNVAMKESGEVLALPLLQPVRLETQPLMVSHARGVRLILLRIWEE